MSTSWEQGSTRAWRRVRAYVLARDHDQVDPETGRPWRCRAHDEGWCARAGAPPHDCERRMTHAHHTKGRAVTGDDPQHIVGACVPCNLKIGDPARAADPPNEGVTRWT